MIGMRHRTLILLLALAAGAVASCGPPRLNASSHELGRKHCAANADCASGICRNGMCG